MTSTGSRLSDRRTVAARRRPSVWRFGLVAVLGVALALPAAAQFSGAAAAKDLLATQVIPLAGNGNGKGDDGGGFGKPTTGRISFGVQPASRTAVDKRPNYTYRNLKPGQRFIDHVGIVNLDTVPVTVDVYPADAFNTPQGGFDVLASGKKSKDLATWVHLGHSSARVPARSTLIMAFEVQVPRNVEPGDHAAGIVASLTTKSKDKKGNIVSVDNRTGMRVYARVEGHLKAKIELERHDAQFHAGPLQGKADVRYTVKNTGNVRLIGKQSIRVSNLLGMSSKAVDVPELPELLPGNEFSFTRPVDGVLPTFLNTAHITVDPVSVTGNVDPALAQVNARTMFFALSWPGLILLLALLGTGGWFLLRWWRRRSSRPGSSGWGDGGSRTPPGDGPGPDDDRVAVPTPPGGRARQGAVVSRQIRTTVAVVLGVGLAIVPMATAAHAETGTLTFIPAQGTAGTPIYSVTSGPCPKEATNLVGYVYGHGMPAEGAVALTNQSAPVNHDGSFGVELRDNMSNIAQEVGAKLQGQYRITMKCIDNFNLKTFAEFSGSINFDTPDHFTAPVPAKPPVAGVPVGYLALVFPEYKKILMAQNENLAPSATAAAGTAASPGAVASAGAVAAGESTANQGLAGGRGGGGDLGWLLVGGIVAALVAFAGAGLLWQRRPAGAAEPAQRHAVEWPDDAPPTKPKATKAPAAKP